VALRPRLWPGVPFSGGALIERGATLGCRTGPVKTVSAWFDSRFAGRDLPETVRVSRLGDRLGPVRQSASCSVALEEGWDITRH
jgi:hypothetical protein